MENNLHNTSMIRPWDEAWLIEDVEVLLNKCKAMSLTPQACEDLEGGEDGTIFSCQLALWRNLKGEDNLNSKELLTLDSSSELIFWNHYKINLLNNGTGFSFELRSPNLQLFFPSLFDDCPNISDAIVQALRIVAAAKRRDEILAEEG